MFDFLKAEKRVHPNDKKFHFGGLKTFGSNVPYIGEYIGESITKAFAFRGEQVADVGDFFTRLLQLGKSVSLLPSGVEHKSSLLGCRSRRNGDTSYRG